MKLFSGKPYEPLKRLSPAATLVAANAAVFVLLRIVAVMLRFAGDGADVESVVGALLLPRTAGAWMTVPWTALTYMFVQYDPFHLIVNMVWLYMFGSVLEKMLSPGQFYSVYLAGGLAGAFMYLAVGAIVPFSPVQAGLTGASASVLGVMSATVVAAPRHKLRLVFFGEVSVRILGLTALLLAAIATGVGSYGVHAAHAGGLVAGLASAFILKRNNPGRSRTVCNPQPETSGKECRDSLDQLLDKIRRSGFTSLTPAERERLISISSNFQKRQT